MSEKKRKKPSGIEKGGRHKNPVLGYRPDDMVNFIIRLIKKKEDRAMSKVIKRAIVLYARKNGYEDEIRKFAQDNGFEIPWDDDQES